MMTYMKILIFTIGMLISSAAFAFVIDRIDDETTKNFFSWIGVVIIVCGFIAGLISFINV